MDTSILKDLLFDLFERFDEYYLIINDLKRLNSVGDISKEEYDYILENYDKWLDEWANKYYKGDKYND